MTTGQKQEPAEVLLQAVFLGGSRSQTSLLFFLFLPAESCCCSVWSHQRFLPGSRFVISLKSIRAAINGGATAGPSEIHTLSPEWIRFSSHPGRPAGDGSSSSLILILRALVLQQIKKKNSEDVAPRAVSDVGTRAPDTRSTAGRQEVKTAALCPGGGRSLGYLGYGGRSPRNPGNR